MNWFKRVCLAQATLAPVQQDTIQDWKTRSAEKVKLLTDQKRNMQQQISQSNQWVQWLNQDSSSNPAKKPANDLKVQEYQTGISDLTSRMTELDKQIADATTDQNFSSAYETNNTGRTGKPVGQFNPSFQQQNLWNREMWGNPFAARLNTLDKRIQQERARFNQ
jgi:hypothetical protein